MTRRAASALVALVALVLLTTAAPARARSPLAWLPITAAPLRQVGDDLVFALRFNCDVPVRELQPGRGRLVCVVLSPDRSSRRRACISRRGGRLRAPLVRIDATGFANGMARKARGQTAGAAVAATLVVDRLRADHALP